MNKKLDVLIISSLSPFKSANLGFDIMKSLEDKGHSVDFLSKYKIKGTSSNILSVYDFEEPIPRKSVFTKLRKCLSFAKKIFKRILKLPIKNKEGIYLLHQDEKTPPVASELILKKIVRKYDFVIIMFWHNMLTAKTLLDIYNNLKIPIFIFGIDMFAMTGGCPTFRSCRSFLKDCTNCLIPKVDNSIPVNNLSYKKDVYNSISCIYIGNTWMTDFVRKSPLFKKALIYNQILPINENIFYYRNQNEIKNKSLRLHSDKFILFAGAAVVKIYRKGFSYLIDAVNLFYESLTPKERENVILLIAGDELPENIKKTFKIEIVTLGYVSIEELAEVYSISDVFLCPSVDDPGPTMINQAIMCGTPVVSFEMGVAFDLVINNKTGYRAKLKDVEDFAKGIKTIYELNDSEKASMSKNCRELALNNYSLPAFAESIEKIYNEYLDKQEFTKKL